MDDLNLKKEIELITQKTNLTPHAMADEVRQQMDQWIRDDKLTGDYGAGKLYSLIGELESKESSNPIAAVLQLYYDQVKSNERSSYQPLGEMSSEALSAFHNTIHPVLFDANNKGQTSEKISEL